jgi:hypothetical protein
MPDLQCIGSDWLFAPYLSARLAAGASLFRWGGLAGRRGPALHQSAGHLQDLGSSLSWLTRDGGACQVFSGWPMAGHWWRWHSAWASGGWPPFPALLFLILCRGRNVELGAPSGALCALAVFPRAVRSRLQDLSPYALLNKSLME